MSLVTLPVDAPAEEILAIIRRDGGIIIKDFMSTEEIDALNADSGPIFEQLMAKPDPSKLAAFGEGFYASNTTHIRSMFAKMPHSTAKIMMHPLSTAQAWVGDDLVTTESSYILCNASAFHVAPGATAQPLHRDQAGHCVPSMEGSLYTALTGCLVAGNDSTERNGATRVLPGSHLYGAHKKPDPRLAVPAVMSKGSAMFWLGSVFHGAGPNTADAGEPSDTRLLYGVFGCKDFLRPDEAFHLITPKEVAKTLPREVLRRAGWAKSSGGLGNINTHHPMDRWDDIAV